MIVTAYKHQQDEFSELFDEMYRLRASTFNDRRKWKVRVVQGREIDVYDDFDPLYVMSVDQSGKLIASLRLLPTTGPHMLADIFDQTMGAAEIIRHPLIWESSRFCVNTDVAETTSTGIHRATAEILLALFETAHANKIVNIVTVYDVYVERIVRRAGCGFERLGEPVAYDDGLKTVAAVASPTAACIQAIRQKTGIESDIYTEYAQVPAQFAS